MWIIWGLLSALGTSVRSVISKHNLGSLSEFMVLWLMFLTASVVSLVLVLVNGIQIESNLFWLYLFVKTILDAVAFTLFLKALKFSSVSLVIPLLSFMPILSSISALFLRGELINIIGVLGIVTISLANLLLYLSEKKANAVSHKNLDRAVIMLVLVMLCWSILDPIHKLGIESSSNITYFSLGNIALFIVLSVMGLVTRGYDLKTIRQVKILVANLTIGIIFVVEFLAQLAAFAQTYVGYVSALKSTYIIMAPFISAAFLKEKLGTAKIIAITVSVAGILLMIFSKEILEFLLTLL